MSRPAPEDVRTVTCIGAGVIGGGWAAYFLARGYRVVAWDPAEDAEARLRHLVQAAWPALTELGLAEGASLEQPELSCTTWLPPARRRTSSKRAPPKTSSSSDPCWPTSTRSPRPTW